mmetsp:Transcript_10668/g.19296  ORF Transcript_10668/g.19296 Transcript_10668/m.19296 type:complete len:80 (+) Transcript_10668:72-311(+)
MSKPINVNAPEYEPEQKMTADILNLLIESMVSQMLPSILDHILLATRIYPPPNNLTKRPHVPLAVCQIQFVPIPHPSPR